MKIPFIHLLRGRGRGPLQLSLPDIVYSGSGVYFRVKEKLPAPEDLKPLITSWLGRHAEDPLRQTLLTYLDSPMLTIQVQPRDAVNPPPMEQIRALRLGELEERRYLEATHVVVVVAADILRPPRIGLWASIACARAAAEALGGVILNPELGRVLSIESCAEDIPPRGRIHISKHILVPCSVNDRGLGWMTTIGMARFGLPDLQIRDIPPNIMEDLVPIMNGVAQYLSGEVMRQSLTSETGLKKISLDQPIQLPLSTVAEAFGAEPPEPVEGARGQARIGLQDEKRRSSRFISLVHPVDFRGDQGVWLNSILADLLGLQETISLVKSDSESMEEAHRRALLEFPGIKDRFNAGLRPGEKLAVKYPFPVQDKNSEYMWVVVNHWQGCLIHGQLMNSPRIRMDLQAGAAVDLPEADVFDWLFWEADGAEHGGYTNRVVQEEGEKWS